MTSNSLPGELEGMEMVDLYRLTPPVGDEEGIVMTGQLPARVEEGVGRVVLGLRPRFIASGLDDRTWLSVRLMACGPCGTLCFSG